MPYREMSVFYNYMCTYINIFFGFKVQVSTLEDGIEVHCKLVRKAVYSLIQCYCRAFHVDFLLRGSADSTSPGKFYIYYFSSRNVDTSGNNKTKSLLFEFGRLNKINFLFDC